MGDWLRDMGLAAYFKDLAVLILMRFCEALRTWRRCLDWFLEDWLLEDWLLED